MNIVTIIGARPQIIKASAISRAIRNGFSKQLKEIIIHTGQHYDANMSEIFFEELEIPHPNYNLDVRSGSHGAQTAKMIEGIENILLKENPDALLVYGDTNSTLAGAIAASKIHVPVIHIEAGLRSYNKSMPEEINRIMCDHVSTLLFSPTRQGYNNLLKEGFNMMAQHPYSADNPKIYHCGDIMLDNSLHFAGIAESKSNILNKHDLTKGNFILGTIHRDNNTDIPERLTEIFNALLQIAEKGETIILPLHPRTSSKIKSLLKKEMQKNIANNANIKIVEPASFLDMIMLEKNCKMIITDSGGVQKEAYFFKKPSLILRSETEWTEILENNAAVLTDADSEKIISGYLSMTEADIQFPEIFGDGKAAEFICSEINLLCNRI
ncbi:MAG: UDP-N-acetylglucosamine 2-epimerase (non-hydrolyzing) [Bacteroidota bacterium]|nr:UDP-N-acetylglucosamine 2-epimerase (non-hydrolyzing) [Bacteroidota bacterium]